MPFVTSRRGDDDGSSATAKADSLSSNDDDAPDSTTPPPRSSSSHLPTISLDEVRASRAVAITLLARLEAEDTDVRRSHGRWIETPNSHHARRRRVRHRRVHQKPSRWCEANPKSCRWRCRAVLEDVCAAQRARCSSCARRTRGWAPVDERRR
ncbi:hypothetical protein RI054_02g12360 [Pseudoscourfieldia marina]